MYTTHVSTLISSCSLNHHFYEDDTQLFLSFLPTHFDSSIDHLQNALDRTSSWMTANLLTLNSSTTVFLLVGLSRQLAKINNSPLNTTHSARNLGFIFDEHLTFLTRSHLSLNLAITIFVSFAVSVHTSTPKQLPPSPLPLFTPSFTTATLYHNLPKSQITQLQQIQNSLNQSSQIQSHHSHPSVSALVKDNWEALNTNSSHLPTKFSQPSNLHICITLSQFSLLAALALHLWSHSLVHPHHLLYE